MATTVGERVRFWRGVRQLSQGQLGSKVKLSQSQIYKLEQGRSHAYARDRDLEKYAEHLQVPVILLREDGPEPADLIERAIADAVERATAGAGEGRCLNS